MADGLYSFGGSASSVVTDAQGNVLANWEVDVLVPATGQIVTDLLAADGVTPLANPLLTDSSGRIPVFKSSLQQVSYRTWDRAGNALPEWREVSPDAFQPVTNALPLSGGTITGPLTVEGLITNPGGRTWHVAGLGVTGGDSQPSIQAAVDAAYALGGGTVVLSGFCSMLGAISLRTGVSLDARRATIQAATTHHLVNNYAAGQNLGGYTGHGNIVIVGGVWDANAYDAASGVGVNTGSNIMTFSHGYNITVAGATFRNVAVDHAVEFNAVNVGLCDSCIFEGYIDSTDAQNRQKAEAIQIDGAIPDGGVAPPQDDTVAQNITVRNCVFRASDRLGPWGVGVGSHSNFLTPASNITVTNCRVYGSLLAGVHPHGWTNSRVVDCYFEDCPAGIRVELTDRQTVDCSSLIFARNTMVRCGDAAASVASLHFQSHTGSTHYSDVLVVDNIVRDSHDNGVTLQQFARVVVRGNQFTNSGGTAMTVSVGSDVVVTSNQVHDGLAANGLYFSSSVTDAVIEGNVLDGGATATGITCSGAVSARVRNNTIRKGDSTMHRGIATTGSGCVVIGNDLSNNGWLAADAFNLAADTITQYNGGTPVPGNNLVS